MLMTEERPSIFIEWIKAAVLGVILFLIMNTFLFSSYVVEGQSMEPTLEEGNRLVVNKIGYQISDIERFDVIVFHGDEGEDYVKRVIGLPGDTITYKNDQLYINGTKVEEPFLKPFKEPLLGQKLTWDFTLKELTGKKRVPENALFVMGDNRLGSKDSRHFGFISIEDVVGKVNVRYWPFKQFNMEF
jgi:signal peptidase I